MAEWKSMWKWETYDPRRWLVINYFIIRWVSQLGDVSVCPLLTFLSGHQLWCRVKVISINITVLNALSSCCTITLYGLHCTEYKLMNNKEIKWHFFKKCLAWIVNSLFCRFWNVNPMDPFWDEAFHLFIE